MRGAVRSNLPAARDVSRSSACAHCYVAVDSDDFDSPRIAVAEPVELLPISCKVWQLHKSLKRNAFSFALLGAVLALAVFGATGGPLRSRGTNLEGKSLVPASRRVVGPEKVCPGNFEVAGFGKVSLVNAAWNKPDDKAGKVLVANGVIPQMKGRAYFANSCTAGPYSRSEYVGMHLLGKTLTYQVDLSGASCGCNAALYLTSMRQSGGNSSCKDYYCDAAKVCGLGCAEIDIQEANTHAWFSTLHVADDIAGLGGGYGATRSTWNASQYGVGGGCIDTARPFSVTASFPIDSNGSLAALAVTLSQVGKPCPLSVRIDSYSPFGRSGLDELTIALRAGMTPIVSYWGADEDLQWMDGLGPGSRGPCAADTPAKCGESVRFWGFAVS